MYSNEYLKHWGAVYVTAHLLEQGIPFQTFLEDPRGFLKAVSLQSAPLGIASGYRPLLPRQRRVAQALWRRWEPEADESGVATPETRLALVAAEESEL
jgi:hypothetical protein